MSKDKVRYGLKNVHYAVLTEGESGDTYAEPVRIPGAVNLAMSPAGESNAFVADDIDYYTTSANNGYDGTLEIAIVPESFETDVMGETLDENGVAFEAVAAQPKKFALLFEFTGDKNQIKHVFYKCSASRSSIEGQATTNREVKTTVLNLSARPNREGYVKAKTRSDSDPATVAAWYTAVPTFEEVVGG
jgi:phi13 family phage major tail protein